MYQKNPHVARQHTHARTHAHTHTFTQNEAFFHLSPPLILRRSAQLL